MRRRGLGVAGLVRQKNANEKYKEIGNELAATEIEQLKKQLEIFRSHLEDFARKYKKDIRKDPVFRMHFQRMCGNVGVDPLASNKGFWAELLGVGDFYYELGIQIVEVCLATRSRNGGLIEFEELKKRILKMRGRHAQEIGDDDIIRSIKTLRPLGNGFELIKIANRRLVRSVPRELNTDQTAVLALAQNHGYVTYKMVKEKLGWIDDRTADALGTLLSDGVCWIDSQTQPEEYWIASYFDMGE
ncbi:uncharacterized protein VTP21DRAFT_11207 [Calcarisporiella thermophila]|uniref:uncharacterized protein n=1 Tax=Calcarisporiella thermophila TaxID=911321 RepID=UPI0037437617